MWIMDRGNRKLDGISVVAKVLFRGPSFEAIEATAAAQDVVVIFFVEAQGRVFGLETASATVNFFHLRAGTLVL